MYLMLTLSIFYPLENLLAVDTHPQVVDAQHVHAITIIKKAPKGTLRASESFIVRKC